MANKNMRTVKIYGMSGYKYQATPTIMLKGKWLEELGFEIGDYITVSCENGRLIITKEEAIEEIVQPVLCVAEGKTVTAKRKLLQGRDERGGESE